MWKRNVSKKKKNDMLIKINHDIWMIIFPAKLTSYNTNKIIVLQDCGENKYSKNIRVTIQIKWLCYKTLERISTAKISEWQYK